MDRRALEAGAEVRGLHSFRRWRITLELQAGESLPSIGRRVGHKNPSTTAMYDTTDADTDAARGRALGRGLFRGARVGA